MAVSRRLRDMIPAYHRLRNRPVVPPYVVRPLENEEPNPIRERAILIAERLRTHTMTESQDQAWELLGDTAHAVAFVEMALRIDRDLACPRCGATDAHYCPSPAREKP